MPVSRTTVEVNGGTSLILGPVVGVAGVNNLPLNDKQKIAVIGAMEEARGKSGDGMRGMPSILLQKDPDGHMAIVSGNLLGLKGGKKSFVPYNMHEVHETGVGQPVLVGREPGIFLTSPSVFLTQNQEHSFEPNKERLQTFVQSLPSNGGHHNQQVTSTAVDGSVQGVPATITGTTNDRTTPQAKTGEMSQQTASQKTNGIKDSVGQTMVPLETQHATNDLKSAPNTKVDGATQPKVQSK